MANERNDFTGMTMKKRDKNESYNPLTGEYRTEDERDIAKQGAKWPSITGRDGDNDES